MWHACRRHRHDGQGLIPLRIHKGAPGSCPKCGTPVAGLGMAGGDSAPLSRARPCGRTWRVEDTRHHSLRTNPDNIRSNSGNDHRSGLEMLPEPAKKVAGTAIEIEWEPCLRAKQRELLRRAVRSSLQRSGLDQQWMANHYPALSSCSATKSIFLSSRGQIEGQVTDIPQTTPLYQNRQHIQLILVPKLFNRIP